MSFEIPRTGQWAATVALASVLTMVPLSAGSGSGADREGNGSGTLSYATRIVAHENNVIELEDFATQPIMLNNIHAEAKNATQ